MHQYLVQDFGFGVYGCFTEGLRVANPLITTPSVYWTMQYAGGIPPSITKLMTFLLHTHIAAVTTHKQLFLKANLEGEI